jgi:integrase
MKISAKSIADAKLESNEKEKIYYDEEIPGFGLRIRSGGSRVLIFTYKIAGKTRRMHLGKAMSAAFPNVRKMAAELHAKVRLGQDPAQDRDDARAKAAQDAAESFRVIADRFLEAHGPKLRPRFRAETKRYLTDVAKPLHDVPVSKIDKRAVAALLSATASKRGDAAANRLQSALSKMFMWAIGEGLLDNNPVSGTNRRPETVRDRILVDKETGDVSELAMVWRAIDDGSTGGDIGKLLILTGCRLTEIAALRWDELDEGFTRIRLPASRTKGKRERVIPLSEPARAILMGRQRIAGWPCVFSSSPSGYTSIGQYKLVVDKRLPGIKAWVWHDLRRSLDTGLGCIGVLPHIVDEIVGHKGAAKAGVRAGYNYAVYLPEMTAALNRWAEHVMSAVTGTSQKVVPLRSA